MNFLIKRKLLSLCLLPLLAFGHWALDFDEDFAASATATVESYVQDGLIAMWDGEWNAGRGTHDPNATVWKDLIGDCDLTVNGTTSWGDKYANIGSATFFGGTIDPVKVFTGNGVAVQTLSTKIGTSDNNGVFAIGDNSNRHLWIWESFAQGSGGMTFSKVVYNTNLGTTYPVLSVDDKVLLTVSYKDGVANSFVGTDPDRSVVIASNQIVGDQPIYIGKIPGHNTYGGKIYCVRLYNRALTQSEIAHNYDVDKARFGL
jgi:hypothetical protein